MEEKSEEERDIEERRCRSCKYFDWLLGYGVCERDKVEWRQVPPLHTCDYYVWRGH